MMIIEQVRPRATMSDGSRCIATTFLCRQIELWQFIWSSLSIIITIPQFHIKSEINSKFKWGNTVYHYQEAEKA